MPGLFLECKSCGKSFPSRIGVNEDARHGVSMNGVRHQCPSCGHEGEYFTPDYFVPTETGERGAEEPAPPVESTERPEEVEARRLAGYGVHS